MKAYNIQKRGGKGMLLVYNSNEIDDNDYNVDDPIGEKVEIPSMIIPKDIGNIIKEFIYENPKEIVTISLKFSGLLKNGKVEIELYYRSDDFKALNFYKEFEYFKEKMESKLEFTPRLKYNVYENEQTSNELSSKSKIPCIKDKPFCVNSENDLEIDNPRLILLENLRQSCIHEIFHISLFWEYMVNFSDKCADYDNPKFNEECSNEIIKNLNLDLSEINACMKDLIDGDNKIEEDYNQYNKKKIFSIPELTINGIKYKGIWSGKSIFKTICNGFIEDNQICSSLTPDEVKYHNLFGFNMIVLISFGIVILIFFSILCYRRMFLNAFEDTLDDKIRGQALKAITQYEAFKDRGSSHKLEMV